jgi:hypothetical protein
MPEVIEKGTDAARSLAMNYDNRIPVLIKAIQARRRHRQAGVNDYLGLQQGANRED